MISLPDLRIPRLLACLAVPLAAGFLACGGGGGRDAPPPTDTTPPTVVITDSASAAVATGPVTFTFTFSEPIDAGFTSSKVTVSGGTKSDFTRVNPSTSKLRVLPDSGTGTLTVNLAAGAFKDMAGNANAQAYQVTQDYGSRLGPPAESEVGPRVALTDRTGGSLAAGAYEGYRFTTAVTLQSGTGAYVFTDCRFDAGFGTTDGRKGVTRTVLVEHCHINGGVYFEYGGQTNWTLRWTRIVGDRKAFRPAGLTGQQDTTSPTPCLVEDSLFSITLTGSPTNHVDTLQALGGNGMTFTRVRFTTPGPYVDGTTGQTSAVNVNAGDTLLDSCEFLEKGAFYYTVYSNAAHVRFRDCRIVAGLAGHVYPSNPNKATFENCVDHETGAAIAE